MEQWALTEEESEKSFEAWKDNKLSILEVHKYFTNFLKPGMSCQRKTKSVPFCGFTDPTAANLQLFFGRIANFASIIARGNIVKNTTSLTSVWQVFYQYYGI